MPNILETLRSGDVIKINNFNMPRIGDTTKHIWAIYLGRDSIFNCPLIVYFCRTTTQIDDFQPGGNREGRKHRKFKKGEFGFDEDCLIDFEEKPYTNITREKFESFDIEVKGKIPPLIMQEIWDKCLKRYLYSPQQTSIRECFSKAGIPLKK